MVPGRFDAWRELLRAKIGTWHHSSASRNRRGAVGALALGPRLVALENAERLKDKEEHAGGAVGGGRRGYGGYGRRRGNVGVGPRSSSTAAAAAVAAAAAGGGGAGGSGDATAASAAAAATTGGQTDASQRSGVNTMSKEEQDFIFGMIERPSSDCGNLLHRLQHHLRKLQTQSSAVDATACATLPRPHQPSLALVLREYTSLQVRLCLYFADVDAPVSNASVGKQSYTVRNV